MNYLTVDSEELSESIARVFYSFGMERKGVIDVEIPAGEKDLCVVAEMVVINHLLCISPGGEQVLSGKGWIVQTTRGAIRKAVLKKTTKTHLLKYARFFNFFLHGISLLTCKNRLSVEDFNGLHRDKITVTDDTYTVPRFEVNTPKIGTVAVTYHAVARYLERSAMDSGGEIEKPLKSLVKRLKNNELVQVPLSENILKQKSMKHHEIAEVWKHPDSTLNFSILRKKVGHAALVTVFVRKQG